MFVGVSGHEILLAVGVSCLGSAECHWGRSNRGAEQGGIESDRSSDGGRKRERGDVRFLPARESARLDQVRGRVGLAVLRRDEQRGAALRVARVQARQHFVDSLQPICVERDPKVEHVLRAKPYNHRHFLLDGDKDLE